MVQEVLEEDVRVPGILCKEPRRRDREFLFPVLDGDPLRLE